MLDIEAPAAYSVVTGGSLAISQKATRFMDAQGNISVKCAATTA